MPGHLDSIVALQHTLKELSAAQTLLDGVPDWMRELHDEHSGRRNEIEEMATAEAEATSNRRQAETVIADAQEKLKRYQSQISQVSTQREYGALLKEIDTVKDEISSAEQVAMEAIDKADEASKALSTLQEAFRELDERYKAELTRWEAEKPSVAATVSTLESRAAELRDDIPRNIQVLFDRLLERSGKQALAQINRVETARKGNTFWSCTACHYQVRPQVVVEIRNEGKLVQCDACKRILYFVEEVEA